VPVAHTCNLSYSEAEIRRINHWRKPTQANSSWEPISKKPFTKKCWWSDSRCRPWVQTPIPPKREEEELSFLLIYSSTYFYQYGLLQVDFILWTIIHYCHHLFSDYLGFSHWELFQVDFYAYRSTGCGGTVLGFELSFVLARQVLYHLSHALSPSGFGYFLR
jgi:hypothetical protein